MRKQLKAPELQRVFPQGLFFSVTGTSQNPKMLQNYITGQNLIVDGGYSVNG